MRLPHLVAGLSTPPHGPTDLSPSRPPLASLLPSLDLPPAARLLHTA